MPEGPEVFSIVNVLEQYIKGSNLVDMELVSGKYVSKGIGNFDIFKQFFPLKVVSFNSKGKFSWIEFEEVSYIGENDIEQKIKWYMSITYGLKGILTLFERKYNRIIFKFKTDEVDKVESENINLYYDDQVSYGNITLYYDKRELDKKLSEIGRDLIKDEITSKEFVRICRSRNHMYMTEFLMCQKYVSGVGNYVKTDSLFLARIPPESKISDLTDERLENFFELLDAYIKFSTERVYLSYSIALITDNLNDESLSETKHMITEKLREKIIEYNKIFKSILQKTGDDKFIKLPILGQVIHGEKEYIDITGKKHVVKCIKTKDKRETHYVDEF